MKVKMVFYFFLATCFLYSQSTIDFIYLYNNKVNDRSSKKLFQEIDKITSKSQKLIFYSGLIVAEDCDSRCTIHSICNVMDDKREIKNQLKSFVIDADYKSVSSQMQAVIEYFDNQEKDFFNFNSKSSNSVLKNKRLNFHFFFDKTNLYVNELDNKIIDRLLFMNNLLTISNAKYSIDKNCHIYIHVNSEDDCEGCQLYFTELEEKYTNLTIEPY